MKKIVLIFIAVLALTMASCTTKEEKLLEGVWQGEVTEVDDDGDEITYRVGMSFDKEKDLMELSVAYSVPQVGEYARMYVSGNWMATEGEITLFADEDSFELKFNPQTQVAASMFGVSLDDFEEMLSDMMKSQFGDWSDIEVYSLKPESMTIDFDGSRLKLHKLK